MQTTIGSVAAMARRIVDYPDAFTAWNEVSGVGSYPLAGGLAGCAFNFGSACIAAGWMKRFEHPRHAELILRRQRTG